MKRIACLTVLAAACGGSGFETKPATLSGITPNPKSASSTSFNAADATGTMVMGWKISFWEQADGADCMSNDTHRLAAVSIYTAMPVTMGKKAMLDAPGDIVIVTDSPPTVQGTAAATMGAEGIGGIVGSISISEFHLKTDLTVDDMKGTVSAAGNDMNGAAVQITGSFEAPVCE
jgi:hypothetical protein